MPPGVYHDDLGDVLDSAAPRTRRRSSSPTWTATVVGTVCLYLDASRTGMGWPTGTAVVRALAVEPAHRGRGTARRLMDECIERAVLAGASTVGLHTASVIRAAVALFERIGFVHDPGLDIDAAELLGPTAIDAPRDHRPPPRGGPPDRLVRARPVGGRDPPADPPAPDLRTDHDGRADRSRHHAGHACPRPRQRCRRRGVDPGPARRPGGSDRRRRRQRRDPRHGGAAWLPQGRRRPVRAATSVAWTWTSTSTPRSTPSSDAGS